MRSLCTAFSALVNSCLLHSLSSSSSLLCIQNLTILLIYVLYNIRILLFVASLFTLQSKKLSISIFRHIFMKTLYKVKLLRDKSVPSSQYVGYKIVKLGMRTGNSLVFLPRVEKISTVNLCMKIFPVWLLL